eukprot:TRINITY_DN92575_c0_g1_i1.p1 TRINITY_DN92575_c0_g1~~TRINITY_DN92575_c0_g1_i1.p1  ORF type:complete len:453 (+),score=89.24 TRINITY_DN92575_c0_g1_i1:124-1482(+)
MGRFDIPLAPDAPQPKQELPRCSWCGDASRTLCGRCKARAYCSTDCQRLDWKSGHQTACVPSASAEAPSKPRAEEGFQLYEVPYVVRWAINLRRWNITADSKELSFLLSRLPDDASRQRIASMRPWSAAKVALARELAVRRMAEVLTQAIWTKVKWRHDEETERDYLIEREEYVWTGKKYQNSDVRFPNFNFSMVETDDYLFLVSHPVAITGIYVSEPLSEGMPDPREAFAEELAQALAGDAECPSSRDAADHDAEAQEDSKMLADPELLEVCKPEDARDRRARLQLALVGKFAYFRTLGQSSRRQWSQVVLGQEQVAATVTGGSPEIDEPAARADGPRRHPLCLAGRTQPRWRCDVHRWRSHCIVVCRGPPEESVDPRGEFRQTQSARYLEIDSYDKALEHMEPDFIQVPIQQLLPDKWHSDYVRACGGGERGEQVRMNYSGGYQPHVPKV